MRALIMLPRPSIVSALLMSLLLLVLGTQVANAFSARTKTLDEAYAGADLVVSVKVTKALAVSINGTQCGTRYTASISKEFKSDNSTNTARKINLNFGRDRSLIPGHRYLLFLKRVTTVEEEYDRITQNEPELNYSGTKRTALELIGCRGMVPGYIFDPETIWQIKGRNIEVFALWPYTAVPSSIRTNSKHGPFWAFDTHDVYRYLVRLAGSSK